MSVWHFKWKRLQNPLSIFVDWEGVCITESVPLAVAFPWKPTLFCFSSFPSWTPSALKVFLTEVQSILKLNTTVLQKFYMKFWKQVWCWSPLSRLLLQSSTMRKSLSCRKKSYPETIATHQFYPDTQIEIQMIHCLFKESWSVVNIRIQSILKLRLQCSNARKSSVGLGMLCSNVPSACSYS